MDTAELTCSVCQTPFKIRFAIRPKSFACPKCKALVAVPELTEEKRRQLRIAATQKVQLAQRTLYAKRIMAEYRGRGVWKFCPQCLAERPVERVTCHAISYETSERTGGSFDEWRCRICSVTCR